MSKAIYDIAVIGSGGASIVADEAMHSELKLAMIEGSAWGGTCLNRGCIPTKIMVHAADVIRESQRCARFSVKGDPLTVDWVDLKRRVFARTAEAELMPDYYKEASNVRLYKAMAAFDGKTSVDGRSYFVLNLRGEEETCILAEKVVIANGGRTRVPEGIGLEEAGFASSESLFNPETWPDKLYDSLIILGGGDIGCEFAHIFSAFGVKVTIVQHSERLAPRQDAELSHRLGDLLVQAGVALKLGKEVVRVTRQGGFKQLHIKDARSGEEETLEADEIFVATGIRSNADSLNLESIGLTTNKRGWIETDEYLETAVPNVFALGDSNGRQQLRHKSNYEATVLAYNLFHAGRDNGKTRRKAQYELVPAATFTLMEMAQIGLNEESAAKQGIAYKVGKLNFSATAQGYAYGFTGDTPEGGFAKVLLSADGRHVIGVHAIAPHASTLVQSMAYLLQASQRPDLATDDPRLIHDTMTIHPSLTELTAWAVDAAAVPKQD